MKVYFRSRSVAIVASSKARAFVFAAGAVAREFIAES